MKFNSLPCNSTKQNLKTKQNLNPTQNSEYINSHTYYGRSGSEKRKMSFHSVFIQIHDYY